MLIKKEGATYYFELSEDEGEFLETLVLMGRNELCEGDAKFETFADELLKGMGWKSLVHGLLI